MEFGLSECNLNPSAVRTAKTLMAKTLWSFGTSECNLNPIALRTTKSLWTFGHSECNMVKGSS